MREFRPYGSVRGGRPAMGVPTAINTASAHLLTLSSPGVPFINLRVEDVATMINSVST